MVMHIQPFGLCEMPDPEGRMWVTMTASRRR